METGHISLNITSNMSFDNTSYLDRFASPTILCIDFIHNFQGLNIDESNRTITSTGFYNGPLLPIAPLCLELSTHEFSPSNLFQVIDSHLHTPPLSQRIAETLASQAVQNRFLQPNLMDVNVVYTQDVFFKEEDCTCAICLEDLRNEDDHEGEIKRSLFYCKHQFHARCIGEWLVRRNTCPLCRGTVDHLLNHLVPSLSLCNDQIVE